MDLSKSELLKHVREEQRAWAAPSSLNFFRENRQALDDLYPSERLFLPEAVRGADSVLDIGCACGGFANVMRALNPQIGYVGIDEPEDWTFAETLYLVSQRRDDRNDAAS